MSSRVLPSITIFRRVPHDTRDCKARSAPGAPRGRNLANLGQRTEMRLVAIAELAPRVGVALAAQMFEGVCSCHAAQSGAHRDRRLLSHAFQEPATKRIANAG